MAVAVSNRSARRVSKVLVYELAVTLPFLAWLAFQLPRTSADLFSPTLLVWLVAIATVDLLPLAFSDSLHFSLSFPLQLAIALLYPPPLAAAITFLGAADPREFRREITLSKASFIRAQIAVSVVVESALFHAMASLDSPWHQLGPAVLLTTVVGYAINVALVAWYVHLSKGSPARLIIRQMHRGILGELVLSYMGLALFGVLIALFFLNEGLLSIVVFIAPLAFARQMMTRTHSLKEATEELEEQRTKLAEIIGHTRDGIFAVDPDGSISAWNPAMVRMTGSEEQDVLGRSVDEVLAPPPESPDRIAQDRSEPLRLGDGLSHDVLVASREGGERWIRYTGNPIRHRDGRLKAHVVVARDVTSELATEQLKNDFIATVSHELRSPLTPLKGFLTMLASHPDTLSEQERGEFFGIMLKQANRLERLINDLLDATRLDRNGLSLEERRVDVACLIREEVEAFAAQNPARPVRWEGQDDGPLTAETDPLRLTQILSNLLSNAVKYSQPDTEVLVSLREARDHVTVSVRDRGDGIPYDHQDRVFDRFHRVETGLARRTGGTGLGLYIAKRLVEAMGGRIWLVSRPGEGSTFTFSIPRPAAQPEPASPILVAPAHPKATTVRSA